MATHRVDAVPVVLERHPNAQALSIVRVAEHAAVVRTADRGRALAAPTGLAENCEAHPELTAYGDVHGGARDLRCGCGRGEVR